MQLKALLAIVALSSIAVPYGRAAPVAQQDEKVGLIDRGMGVNHVEAVRRRTTGVNHLVAVQRRAVGFGTGGGGDGGQSRRGLIEEPAAVARLDKADLVEHSDEASGHFEKRQCLRGTTNCGDQPGKPGQGRSLAEQQDVFLEDRSRTAEDDVHADVIERGVNFDTLKSIRARAAVGTTSPIASRDPPNGNRPGKPDPHPPHGRRHPRSLADEQSQEHREPLEERQCLRGTTNCGDQPGKPGKGRSLTEEEDADVLLQERKGIEPKSGATIGKLMARAYIPRGPKAASIEARWSSSSASDNEDHAIFVDRGVDIDSFEAVQVRADSPVGKPTTRPYIPPKPKRPIIQDSSR